MLDAAAHDVVGRAARVAGPGSDGLRAHGQAGPLQGAQAQLLAPCLTDPPLDIRRASIRLQHRARNRADGSLLVSGPVQIACVELATMRPAPLPDEVFNRLRSHAMSLPADPGTP